MAVFLLPFFRDGATNRLIYYRKPYSRGKRSMVRQVVSGGFFVRILLPYTCIRCRRNYKVNDATKKRTSSV